MFSAKKPVLLSWTCTALVPTGEATTGRPAAAYSNTLKLHLPRVKGLSGRGAKPIMHWPISVARLSNDQRRVSTGTPDKLGVRVSAIARTTTWSKRAPTALRAGAIISR